jgi:excisionase family DNA binding protein
VTKPRVDLSTPLLTAQEAARLLRVEPSTVYEWCRSGVMPHIKLGRRVLFTRRMLEAWAENSITGGDA